MNYRGFNFSINKKPFKAPTWFSDYWNPDDNSRKYWEWQYQLAKDGKEYKLPEETMRSQKNELHQLMAKEFFNEILEKYNNFDSILDIGCSDGYMVNYFCQNGKKAMGIEYLIYPTDRLFTEENNILIKEMDMHSLDFSDESFDAVWCRHTLEHSFSPLQVLAECNRVLKKNGYLFCTIPPVPQPPEPYHGHFHQIPDYQLQYLLEMCNFEIINLKNINFSYKSENDNAEIRSISRKISN